MMSNDIVLSIVIANYNYGRFIRDAITSVLRQQIPEVELIVVDGGSTDDSIGVIKQYADKLAWWVSEKDKGQSDAFNKGFAHAKGKYLTWLNADDVLIDGCLSGIVSEMKRHPECEWFTGNYFRFLQHDGSIYEMNWGPHVYPKFLQQPNSPIVSYGPTTFFSRKIYEQVGRIDESLHFAMDSDLWLRFQAAGIKQRRVNCMCWAFRMHEESKTAEFSGHRCSNETGQKFALEHQRSVAAVGYQLSVALAWALYVVRLIDGSLIRRWVMRVRAHRQKFDVAAAKIVKTVKTRKVEL